MATSHLTYHEGFPVIDIAPFLSGHAPAIVSQWREAFTTLGFALVIGHGVSPSLLEEMYSVSDKFFSLPMGQKMACCLGKGYGPGGYCPPGSEQVTSSQTTPDGNHRPENVIRPPDAVENILFHCRDTDVIPATPPNYKEVMHRYWKSLIGLLNTAMELTALSFELPSDYFKDSFANPSCVLRLAHYPPQEKPDHDDQLRYGEHTDYTGYTFLSTNAPGLQVLFPDGQWKGTHMSPFPFSPFIDCPVIKDAFIVNAGDLIQVWTNDIFLSNRHRVVTPDSVRKTGKTSIVFFTGPSDDTMIECLPPCHSESTPPKYKPTKSGDHLARKIRAGNAL